MVCSLPAPTAAVHLRSLCFVGLLKPSRVLPPPLCLHLGCFALRHTQHFRGITLGAMLWYFPASNEKTHPIGKCPISPAVHPVQFPHPRTVPQHVRAKPPFSSVCAHGGSFNHHRWLPEKQEHQVSWRKSLEPLMPGHGHIK